MRDLVFVVALLLSIPLGALAQQNPDLEKYFRHYVGLSEDQIATIRNGQPVTKALPSRTPDEVFLFGAIYVHTAPEKYVQFAHDYNRLRKLPGNLALGVFSNPPTLSDLKDFTFDNDDIKAVKNCKLGDCLIQAPEGSIEELQKSINWFAADVNDQVNQQLQKAALSVYECFPFIWPYNAHPVLFKNSIRPRQQGRNADYTTKWIASGLLTTWWVSC
jgi:hypothetical protein